MGHNHPDVRDVLQATLAADFVDGVQIHYSPLAGMLAEALSQRLPQGLDAVFFASTGAEAVDSAMKFARAATRRPRLISCDSSFHGVTLGPLIRKITPYMTKPDEPGQWQVIGDRLNPGSHDDTPPAKNELKGVFTYLSNFVKDYLRPSSPVVTT